MIILECCPPFQPKPKLTRLWGGWHFIWLWFGFHYAAHSLNDFVEAAVKMGREQQSADADGEKVKAETPDPQERWDGWPLPPAIAGNLHVDAKVEPVNLNVDETQKG